MTEFCDTTTCQSGPDLPIALHSHCSVSLEDKALFIGGVTQGPSISTKTFVYEPNAYTFFETSSPSVARYASSCASMTWSDGKAKVFLFGGRTSLTLETRTTVVEVYDVLSGLWTTGPSFPVALSEVNKNMWLISEPQK